MKNAEFDEEQFVNELSTYLDELATQDIYSGNVLVACNDRVIFSGSYGLASKRFKVPNNLETKFNMGSNNKMFTGLAICQLVEQGKMSMHIPISNYLDETDFPLELAQKITTHHLLTHTSGLPASFPGNSPHLLKVSDFVQELTSKEIKLVFEPGEGHQYSNSGFILAGRIIETVSGMDYYDYIQKHIAEPIGMYNTDFYSLDEPNDNLAIGYTRRGYDDDDESEQPLRNNNYMIPVKGCPAGGCFSTVDDMHKFALAMMKNELLDPEMTETMMAFDKPPDEEGYRLGYGIGGKIRGDYTFMGHLGGAPGIGSFLQFDIESRFIIIVFTNYDPDVCSDLGEKIRNMIIGI